MIPLSLEITNFLSYRETAVLDFNGLHLACISGANGAGKSSILDAITWALFGKARTRSDDDLVNRVAAANGEMALVRFDFQLGDSCYRVQRRKKVGRTVELEFQLALDGDTAGERQWKPLSEGKSRETQGVIEQTLNMTYDVFANASFLLQGQADAFTTKTANQRKEILADLLGVSRWDGYRDRATARRKEIEAELRLLDDRYQGREEELGEEATRQAAVDEAEAAHAAIVATLTAEEQLLDGARQTADAVARARRRLEELTAAIAAAERELAGLRKRREERRTTRAEHQRWLDEAEAIRAAHTAWQAADADFKSWQSRHGEHSRLSQLIRPHELEIERARTALEQQIEALKRRREEVAAARETRESVVAAVAAVDARLAALVEQLAAQADEAGALRAAEGRLNELRQERRLQEQRLATLAAQVKQREGLAVERERVAGNLAEADTAVERLQTRFVAWQSARDTLKLRQEEQRRLADEQPDLRRRMEDIQAQIEMVAAGETDECPLCAQPLTEIHRATVVERLRADGTEKGDAWRANQTRLKELDGELARLEKTMRQDGRVERDFQQQQERVTRARAQLESFDQRLAETAEVVAEHEALAAALADTAALQKAQEQVATLQVGLAERAALEKARQAAQTDRTQHAARLEQLEQRIAAWEETEAAELAAAEERLVAGDFAVDARAAFDALQAELVAVAFDDDAYNAARAAVEALAEAPRRFQTLQQAEAAVKPLDEALADLDEQVTKGEARLAEQQAQRATAESDLAALEEGAVDVNPLEKRVLALREQASEADRRVGAVRQKLSVLADLRAQQASAREERADLTRLIQRLQVLERACGRDGIQALLIEQAVPELEESANELLDRLSGGKMHVRFDTQRQLKSRDALAETLDIVIMDEAGERPYEAFSGGEQFRVNFAVRLALSRVLAHRAGASLQTLVIDEGFGSQDPTGRQRLVEAINTIQEDFAVILVITHIDELRDAFPARIEVEKGPLGSIIAVS